MWKPSQRIKHPLPEAKWPTRAEAAASRLFSALRLGAVELRERTWVPAMVPWRATEDGEVTDDVIEWYQRFAQGRPGALVVEATGIRDIPSGPLLRVGHDRTLAGLRRLVEAVRRASDGQTRIFLQVIDFLTIRRRPESETYFQRYLKLRPGHIRVLSELDARSYDSSDEAAIRARLTRLDAGELERVLDERELEALHFGYRERVTDVDLEHIRRLPVVLPGLFAAAAARAEAAGFDGVELHFAHAYTLASFLSARNDRSDGYGGDLAGRVRLPLEVLAAVRDAVGKRFAIGCRYLTEDCLEGGSTVDDACHFGVRFAEAGVDFLSLSRGGKFEDARQPKIGAAAYPYTGPSGYECMPTAISDELGPFGRNLEAAGRVRAAVRAAGYATPIVVAGGICTFEQAEAILADGKGDVVAAARQSLADPDWFLKMRLGRGDEVCRCIYSNYCEGLDLMHKQVTCQLWDREALSEPGLSKSTDGKRRLVAPAWDGAVPPYG